MPKSIPDILQIVPPRADPVPVVLDSPHSGLGYPADFRSSASTALLDSNADMHVQDLYGDAPQWGASLLHALFSRSYIDANRDEEDIDEAVLAEPWPVPIQPSVKTRLGRGLIRRHAAKGVPVYSRKLSVEEVRGRIDGYYRPYHRALQALLEQQHQRFGKVWHLNCHSMPAVGRPLHEDAGKMRPDVVLGNHHGASAGVEFTELVRSEFAQRGYEVRVNDPYKGQVLTRAYSDPSRARQSLQIELNRRFYMNEESGERLAGYAPLKSHLNQIVQAVCSYARQQLED